MASLKETYDKVRHYYATQIALIPPQPVREILEQQGWQFEQTPAEPFFGRGAGAWGAHHTHHALITTIKTNEGQNVFTSGPQALKLYENALDRAARKVYGLNL